MNWTDVISDSLYLRPYLFSSVFEFLRAFIASPSHICFWTTRDMLVWVIFSIWLLPLLRWNVRAQLRHIMRCQMCCVWKFLSSSWLHQCIDEHLLMLDHLLNTPARPQATQHHSSGKSLCCFYLLRHIDSSSPRIHLSLLNIAEIKIKTTSMTNVTFIDFQTMLFDLFPLAEKREKICCFFSLGTTLVLTVFSLLWSEGGGGKRRRRNEEKLEKKNMFEDLFIFYLESSSPGVIPSLSSFLSLHSITRPAATLTLTSITATRTFSLSSLRQRLQDERRCRE